MCISLNHLHLVILPLLVSVAVLWSGGAEHSTVMEMLWYFNAIIIHGSQTGSSVSMSSIGSAACRHLTI